MPLPLQENCWEWISTDFFAADGKKGSEALNSEDTQSHQQSCSAESEEKEICGGGKEGNQCGVNTGAVQEASDSEDSGTAGLMMRLIIIFVAAGLAFGYFYVRTQIAEPEAFHEKGRLCYDGRLMYSDGKYRTGYGTCGQSGGAD